MVFRHDTCNFIAEACRDIRDRTPNQSRYLIILKGFNLIHLNEKEVDRMVKKNDWSLEFGKRIPINFNKMIFTDVILPVTFDNGVWVLMSWNFE